MRRPICASELADGSRSAASPCVVVASGLVYGADKLLGSKIREALKAFER